MSTEADPWQTHGDPWQENSGPSQAQSAQAQSGRPARERRPTNSGPSQQQPGQFQVLRQQRNRVPEEHRGAVIDSGVHGSGTWRGGRAKQDGAGKGKGKSHGKNARADGDRRQNSWASISEAVGEFAIRFRQQRLDSGLYVSADSVLERINESFGATFSVHEVHALSDLVRLEQALRQFLQSFRAHAVVWAVADMEDAFMRSKLQKKSWDVTDWASLRVGASLAQHPILAETFPEFYDAWIQWASAESKPELMNGVDVLQALLQYRMDVGFTSVVNLNDFRHWLERSRDLPMERLGVIIDERKLALVMAGQNAALSDKARLRRNAQERYLAEMTQLTEFEIQAEMRQASELSIEARQQADRFLQRWRRVAENKPFGAVLMELSLWTRHVLDAEPPPFVTTLVASLVCLLHKRQDGDSNVTTHHRPISPLELAEAVRRHLEDLPADAGLDAQGLLRLEEAVVGHAGSVEALVPGGSLLRLVAENRELRHLLDCRLQGQSTAVASGGKGLPAETLLGTVLECLAEQQRQSAVIDASSAAELERSTRLRLGRNAPGDWGGHGSLCAMLSYSQASLAAQGWTVCAADCDAIRLWQNHVSRILRAGGARAVASHFGSPQPLAVGVPGLAPTAQQNWQSSSLYYEAALLTKFAPARKPRQQSDADMFEEELEAEHTNDVVESVAGLLGEVNVQDAIAALLRVDYLEDVEEATAWNEVFAPCFGPLIDFADAQAEAGHLVESGICLFAVAPRALFSAKLTPQLVRLPLLSDSSADDFAGAAESGDANLAAALLAAMCVDDPSALATFGFHLTRGLDRLANRYGHREGLRAAFGVAMLYRLPAGLREVAGEAAVLPAMRAEIGWVENAVAAARRLNCSKMLALLGRRWGVQEWGALLSAPPQRECSDALFARAYGAVVAESAVQGSSATEIGPPMAQHLHQRNGILNGHRHGASDTTAPGADLLASSSSHGVESVGQCAGAKAPLASKEVEAAADGSECAVIQEICSGFLLDQQSASSLQENLGGSLRRLGDDLYREQHHFVFELLQNADDCGYLPGVVPKFKLVLDSDQLCALSNERGFNERDVRALCAVDSSTKPSLSSDGRERIGRKGIGFKSVFKITDTPIIHSGPWHFHFDAQLPSPHGINLKGLGYIVPKWLPPADKLFKTWTTELRLPFKRGLGEDERAHLQRDLAALNGVLLLNLSSLRSVELLDRTVPGEILRTLGRRDLFEQQEDDLMWRIVQIRDSGSFRTWFSVDGSFPFSTEAGKRINITLSFPLPCASSTAEWLREEHPLLPTYCYLPLRSFGWRIAVHANFDVTASRNEIHDNSPWNVKIRNSLPLMFVHALRLAKHFLMLPPISVADLVGKTRDALKHTNPQITEIPCIPYSFIFRFVPLPGSLGGGDGDFFSGVETKIWQRLKAEKCVLSTEGTWVEPNKALFAPSAMQQVIPSGMLKEHHKGMQYLHPECEGITSEIAKRLGLGSSSACFRALTTVVRSIAEGNHPEGRNCTWLRSVLVVAYTLMFGDGSSVDGNVQDRAGSAEMVREQLAELKQLRILPASDGNSFVAPCEYGAFLPSAEELTGLHGRLIRSLGLKLVDPDLVVGDGGDIVRRLLTRCGLKQLSVQSLLVDGVLPFLEGGVDESNYLTLADCIALLAQERDTFQDCDAVLSSRPGARAEGFRDAVRRALVLPCRPCGGGPLTFVPIGTPAILSAAFHEKLSEDPLDDDFREAHSTLASQVCHLGVDLLKVDESCSNVEEVSIRILVAFLRDCGVALGLFPTEAVEKTLESKEAFQDVAVGFNISETEDITYPATLFDSVSPTLIEALQNPDEDIYATLVASFVVELRDYLTAKFSCSSGAAYQGFSTVAMALRRAAWVPCKGKILKAPVDVNFLADDTPSAVQDEFNIVDDKKALKCRSGYEFLHKLGVRELSGGHVLDLLRAWSSRGRSNLSEGQMANLYRFLYHWQLRERTGVVQEVFALKKEKLLFIPDLPKWTKVSQRGNPFSNYMDGKWVCADDCCVKLKRKKTGNDDPWLSKMGAIRELELHYSLPLSDPFKAFGVSEYPSIDQLGRSIESAARTQAFDDALSGFHMISRLWAESARDSEEEHPRLRAQFAKRCTVPTENGQWVAWLDSRDSAENAEGAVEVFLPPAAAPGQVVLSSGVSRQGMWLFQTLGMKLACAALAEESAAGAREEVMEDEENADTPAQVRTSARIENTQQEHDLRATMAYLQCWLFQTHPGIYHRCSQRADEFNAIGMEVCEDLCVNGIDVPAHWDHSGRILYVSSTQLGMGLQSAVRPLLRQSSAVGLPPGLVSQLAEKVCIDVLIRLAQSSRPGCAAQQVLAQHGARDADPASLPLAWWFREAPLPLEEKLPTLCVGAGPGGAAAIARVPTASPGGAPSASSQMESPALQHGGSHGQVEDAAPSSGGVDSGGGTAKGRGQEFYGEDMEHGVAQVHGRDIDRAEKQGPSIFAMAPQEAVHGAGGGPAGQLRSQAAQMMATIMRTLEAERDTRRHVDLIAHHRAACMQQISNLRAQLRSYTNRGRAIDAHTRASQDDGDDVDPWAEWARRRASQVEDAVSEVERIPPPPGLEDCRAAAFAGQLDACRSHVNDLKVLGSRGTAPWATNGSRGQVAGTNASQEARSWAVQQAQLLEEFTHEAERQMRVGGAIGQHIDEFHAAAVCREHSAELRAWAQANVMDMSEPPQWSSKPRCNADSGEAWKAWAREKTMHLDDTLRAVEGLMEGGRPIADRMAASLESQFSSLEQWATDHSNESASSSGRGSAWGLSTAEEVKWVDDAKPLMPDVLNQAHLEKWQERQVARWGEEWVFKWLKRKFDGSEARVRWMNEVDEQGYAYDIAVSFTDSALDCFYEVKSTITMDKALVEISEPEVLEAARLGSRYSLVRVYGAGTPAAQMMLLANLSAQWRKAGREYNEVDLFIRVPIPNQTAWPRAIGQGVLQ